MGMATPPSPPPTSTLHLQLLGHVDFVPTDALAVFLLEARLQQAERAAATAAALGEPLLSRPASCASSRPATAGPSPERKTSAGLVRPPSLSALARPQSLTSLAAALSAASPARRPNRDPGAAALASAAVAAGDAGDGVAPSPLFKRSSSAAAGTAAAFAVACAVAADEERSRASTPRGPPRAPSPAVVAHHHLLLTPSSAAAALRPDLGPAAAARAGSAAAPRVSLADVGAACHISHFAFASYGYLLYLWARPRHRGACELLCPGGCCGAVGPGGGGAAAAAARGVPGTKALTRQAILQITGLPAEDVPFIRYRSDAANRAVLPYFISVDRPTTRRHGGGRLPPAIVVAIRGTLSAADVLTDALCEAERADDWLCAREEGGRPPSAASTAPPTPLYAHAGILAAARAVAADIEGQGVLDAMLEGGALPLCAAREARAPREAAAADPESPQPPPYPHRVIITGHSLGAGVAVLLGLRLRARLAARAAARGLPPPPVAVWAFAPPGGLACPATAASAAPFTTAVAVGKDWVPRLSLRAVERLRDDMVVAAARCRVPKAALLVGWAFGKKWTADQLFRPVAEVSGDATAALTAVRAGGVDERPRLSGVDALHAARDFVPATRLMLLRPIKPATEPTKAAAAAAIGTAPAPVAHLRRHAARRAFEAVWVPAAALASEGILLSTRMGLDHLPDYSVAVLRRMARGEYDGAGGGGDGRVADFPRDGTLLAPRGADGADPGTAPPPPATTLPPRLARISSRRRSGMARRTSSGELLDRAEAAEAAAADDG